MEWGLRKVLPKLKNEQRKRFIQHILPVIIELCGSSMTEEERGVFAREMAEALKDATDPKDASCNTESEESSCSENAGTPTEEGVSANEGESPPAPDDGG